MFLNKDKSKFVYFSTLKMLKCLFLILIFGFSFGIDLLPTTVCTSTSGCRQFWNHIRVIIEINDRKISKFIPFDVKIDEQTKLHINASKF